MLILSIFICFASSIWRARANSYNSFMGACVLNGIGAGPAETAQPTIIADVIFLHDRGKYQTLYFAFYFGSLMVYKPHYHLTLLTCLTSLGWTYHLWPYGPKARVAKFLVAQHCPTRLCRSLLYLPLPRDQIPTPIRTRRQHAHAVTTEIRFG